MKLYQHNTDGTIYIPDVVDGSKLLLFSLVSALRHNKLEWFKRDWKKFLV